MKYQKNKSNLKVHKLKLQSLLKRSKLASNKSKSRSNVKNKS